MEKMEVESWKKGPQAREKFENAWRRFRTARRTIETEIQAQQKKIRQEEKSKLAIAKKREALTRTISDLVGETKYKKAAISALNKALTPVEEKPKSREDRQLKRLSEISETPDVLWAIILAEEIKGERRLDEGNLDEIKRHVYKGIGPQRKTLETRTRKKRLWEMGRNTIELLKATEKTFKTRLEEHEAGIKEQAAIKIKTEEALDDLKASIGEKDLKSIGDRLNNAREKIVAAIESHEAAVRKKDETSKAALWKQALAEETGRKAKLAINLEKYRKGILEKSRHMYVFRSALNTINTIPAAVKELHGKIEVFRRENDSMPEEITDLVRHVREESDRKGAEATIIKCLHIAYGKDHEAFERAKEAHIKLFPEVTPKPERT